MRKHLKINTANTNVDDNLYLFRMRQTIKKRFVIMNSVVYLAWISGIWYLTKGKKYLYKPLAHSDAMLKAKDLVTKHNPTSAKIFFNETAYGGLHDKKAIFDVQFGSTKMFGIASFEADMVDNQWIFKKAVANYNVEQRANVQKITKSLLDAN